MALFPDLPRPSWHPRPGVPLGHSRSAALPTGRRCFQQARGLLAQPCPEALAALLPVACSPSDSLAPSSSMIGDPSGVRLFGRLPQSLPEVYLPIQPPRGGAHPARRSQREDLGATSRHRSTRLLRGEVSR